MKSQMEGHAKAIFANVRALAPAISRRSNEIEAARGLPGDLLAQLKEAGVFRMLVPRSHGGMEIDFPSSMEIIEELASADGSVGWTVMIGCETPQFLALLPRDRFDFYYASNPDFIIGGGFAPRGTAQVIDGGYLVNGRWAFASGCQHADLLMGNCVVLDNGAPRAGSFPGTQEVRAMLLPKERVQILDTWRTAGMRGTGSHDIQVENLRVAAPDTFDIFFGRPSVPGPLNAEPTLYALLHICAVAAGIARRALAEVLTLAAGQKRRLYTGSAMAEMPLVQHRVGEADTALRAARQLLLDEAHTVWNSARAGASIDPGTRTRIMGSAAWIARSAASVVDTCYTAGGGSALYESSPLQRCLRDIHTLTQHAAVNENMIARAGAALLGSPPAFTY
jgi:alkylation response protein AidB-like acyl-CoA dehydrogenase